MWSFMDSADPTVFTKSNKEGVKKVLEQDGMYAFLMESNSIQYQIERYCDLQQIGGLLDSKGYGIAFTPGESSIVIHFFKNNKFCPDGTKQLVRSIFLLILNLEKLDIWFFCLGSPYRTPFSSAILQLQEKGRLHVLKARWWKKKGGGRRCNVRYYF